jgi:hypothetical protein
MRYIVWLAALFCGAVQAQATQAEASRPWKWEVSAYMLGAGMDGKTGVRPNVAEVDESFSDILDNLQFGFMGRARATHGVWSFGTDIIYMGLGASSDQPNLGVDVDQWAVELNSGFQLTPTFMSLVGARYNQLSTSIAFQTIGRQKSGKVDWWDPIIGGILTLPIGEHWNFQFHGDIGGFGVGSDFAWQAEMLFNWFVTPDTSIMMGYRAVSTDYDDNGFVYDVVSQGPQLGVTMRF